MTASELNDSAEAAERRKALETFATVSPNVPKGFTWGMAGNVLIGRLRDPAFVRGLQRS